MGHATDWVLLEKNMGTHLSIDETQLCNEVYTILSNKAGVSPPSGCHERFHLRRFFKTDSDTLHSGTLYSGEELVSAVLEAWSVRRLQSGGEDKGR